MSLASATIPAQSSGQAEIELLSVLTEIESDPTLPILSIQIQERLFQIQASSDDSWTWRDYAIYRRTITSLKDRIWYWVDTILPPTPLEWQIVALPRPLFPLYYLVRLVRLILKHLFRIDV